jgi:hypothetical protein
MAGSGIAQLGRLYLQSNNLDGGLPVEWGVPANLSILELQNVSNFVFAAPFRSLQTLVLWQNQITGVVPLEWTNNPHLFNAIVVINQALFVASGDSPDFARGVCLNPSRYTAYRIWAIGIVQSEVCEENVNHGFIYKACLVPVANTGLDPCLMDPKTKVALIALWTCFGIVVLLVCLEQRAIRLLCQRVKRLETHRGNAMAWINIWLSPQRRLLIGMLGTVAVFWADIASDIPVLIESWQKKGVYFFALLGLMFGSHIIDAILVARYAVARGNNDLEHHQSKFSRLLQDVTSFMVSSFVARGAWGFLTYVQVPGFILLCLAQNTVWFVVYFFCGVSRASGHGWHGFC